MKKKTKLRSVKPVSVSEVAAAEKKKHPPKVYTLSGVIKFGDKRILMHPLKHDFADEQEVHRMAERLQAYLAAFLDVRSRHPEAEAFVLAADKEEFTKIYADMTRGLIERGIDPMTGKEFQ